MLGRALHPSLALRLALLFALGSSVLLLALGVGLAWLVRIQLEARDREEIDGKTEVVLHLFGELRTAEKIAANPTRFADIVIGHPHLQLGLRQGSRWLVEPMPDIRALTGPSGSDPVPHAPQLGAYQLGENNWWLRRIDFLAEPDRVFTAYVGVHVTPTQQLLARLVNTMLAVGGLGVIASTLLGWLVARRGLAPITKIAREAERVTAERLGEPMRAADAPQELLGLVGAINRMLDRLQASFRSLEEFSADIAHELRTPLNNLMLQTQVTLSRPRSSEEYQEALHSNLAELEHLRRMVSDMLFLARADRGMVELKVERVDLASEARSVAEYFEAAATEQGKRIEVTGSASALCDKTMTRRALTNLLSNALHYSPSGSRISVRLAQPDAARAIVEVRNPAPPMSQDELRRLFARFTRGSTAGASDGAGLGLSIVASIMRLHGGTVTAESDPSGVCFRLSFPLEPAAGR
ncbi:MAG: heavy metal sensor histidine kinase [Pseudomonadota bacterium]